MINKYSIIIVTTILFLTGNTFLQAQTNQIDPSFEVYRNLVNTVRNRSGASYPECLQRKLSVHIHSIGENDSTGFMADSVIIDHIDTINTVFSKICLSFEICKIEHVQNSVFFRLVSDDIDAMISTYNDPNVINIYLVSSNDSETEPGGYLVNTPADAIILTSTYLSSTIHQLGHFFGLVHTHENPGTELVDRTNCETAGDLLCDTEADPNINSQVNSNCQYIYGTTDSNGHYYTPPIFNFMSLSDNSCRSEFSPMQWRIIVETLKTTRSNLR